MTRGESPVNYNTAASLSKPLCGCRPPPHNILTTLPPETTRRAPLASCDGPVKEGSMGTTWWWGPHVGARTVTRHVAYACGLALKGRGHEDAVRAWIQQPAVLSPAVCRPRNGMEWTLHCVCLGTTCTVLQVGWGHSLTAEHAFAFLSTFLRTSAHTPGRVCAQSHSLIVFGMDPTYLRGTLGSE